MAAQLTSVCEGSVFGIYHAEFGKLATLSQAPVDGFYVLTMMHPTKWQVIRGSIIVDERAHEIHKFKSRTEARDFLIAKFWTRFIGWD
jgi:hypothetical protein